MSTEESTELEPGTLGISEAAVGIVAGYAALAGLCPLIPVPFVDDLIINRIQRRMYRKLSEQNSFRLAEEDAKLLASRSSNLLEGAIKSMLLWPIKKIIRKIVYVLAIKACADVATAVFHEGWLFARAMEQEYVQPDAVARGDTWTVERLRDAIVCASDEVGPDAGRQLVISAYGLGRDLTGPLLVRVQDLLSLGDDDAIDAARREVTPLADRLREELHERWLLAPQLDAALRAQLGRT